MIQRTVIDDVAAAEAFSRDALARGHEGVMAKSLDAGYDAGRRGGGWLKIKRAHTLDLVVLAAEWGSGRRKGWLVNLHLGARAADGELRDARQDLQGHDRRDARLADRASCSRARPAATRTPCTCAPSWSSRSRSTACRQSPHYPGGLALRFARVKAYRPDKRADEADTIDTVRGFAE